MNEIVRLNRDEIKKLIPHREPFLWLDEVSILSDQKIQARKLVSPEEDLFRGHYPQYPILPGVILCEMCFQAGALLIAHTQAVAGASGGREPPVTFNNEAQAEPVAPGVPTGESGGLRPPLADEDSPQTSDQVPVVTRINQVRFKRMVRPGDLVEIEVELTERLANAYFLKGKASVGGKLAVQLEFACAAVSGI